MSKVWSVGGNGAKAKSRDQIRLVLISRRIKFAPQNFFDIFFLTIRAYLIHLSKSYPYLNTEIK